MSALAATATVAGTASIHAFAIKTSTAGPIISLSTPPMPNVNKTFSPLPPTTGQIWPRYN